MMDLRLIQNEQDEWSQKNFPGNQPWQPLLGMGEELGELMHHYLKASQGIRNTEDHLVEMVDAVGDIVIYMMDFCNRMGIDLESAIQQTWAGVKRRDWQKNPDTAHEGTSLADEIKREQVRTGEQVVIDNLKKLGM